MYIAIGANPVYVVYVIYLFQAFNHDIFVSMENGGNRDLCAPRPTQQHTSQIFNDSFNNDQS